MKERVHTAIILAAGMGVRLQDYGKLMPKGFLRLGARPIIEESILKLRAAGIERVLIVTGHCSGHYERLARRYPGLVQLIYNEHYASSGSMYSLYCARDELSDDFLLLESDLIYERRALKLLLEFPRRDAILLSGPTNAGDEIYVETRAGNLVDMSKDRATLGAEIAGELVGISRVSRPLFTRMVAIASGVFRESLRLDYETECFVRAGASWPIPCPVLPDLVWTEIDFEEHLERARREIYPVLRGDLDGIEDSPHGSGEA